MKTFLAGVQVDGRIFWLQTVTLRQKHPYSPFCSKCTRQSCVHWQSYKKLEKEEENEFAFNHHIQEDGTNDSYHDDMIQHEQ